MNSPSLQFLPSPRSISVSIHTDEFRPHDHLMVISAIWGEFVHHDVSHTPQGWKADFAPSKHPNNLGSGLRDPACSRNLRPTIFLTGMCKGLSNPLSFRWPVTSARGSSAARSSSRTSTPSATLSRFPGTTPSTASSTCDARSMPGREESIDRVF